MDVTNLPTTDADVFEHPVQESAVLLAKGVSSEFNGNSVRASEVTFRAGERTKWHTHDGVQILYVTHGEGIVATRAEEHAVSEGDLVVFSPDEEHWHGNTPEAAAPFSHISFIAQPEGADPTVVD